jgi:hypothetical protein
MLAATPSFSSRVSITCQWLLLMSHGWDDCGKAAFPLCVTDMHVSYALDVPLLTISIVVSNVQIVSCVRRSIL